jgi:beta-glucosidase
MPAAVGGASLARMAATEKSAPGATPIALSVPPGSAPEGPPDPDLALLMRLRRSGIPVVAVFLTGRPRGVTPELQASDAFVVAWLPGSEGGGIADVLFRKSDGHVNADFTGKLSFEWPRGARQTVLDSHGEADRDGQAERHDGNDSPLFPYGFGLSYCIRDCRAPSS